MICFCRWWEEVWARRAAARDPYVSTSSPTRSSSPLATNTNTNNQHKRHCLIQYYTWKTSSIHLQFWKKAMKSLKIAMDYHFVTKVAKRDINNNNSKNKWRDQKQQQPLLLVATRTTAPGRDNSVGRRRGAGWPVRLHFLWEAPTAREEQPHNTQLWVVSGYIQIVEIKYFVCIFILQIFSMLFVFIFCVKCNSKN